jgi:hypothetical protein
MTGSEGHRGNKAETLLDDQEGGENGREKRNECKTVG